MHISANTRALAPDIAKRKPSQARRTVDPDRYEIRPVFERSEDRGRQGPGRRSRPPTIRLRENDERQSDAGSVASARPSPGANPALSTGATDLWTLLNKVTPASPPLVASATGRIEEASLDDLFAKVMARA